MTGHRVYLGLFGKLALSATVVFGAGLLGSAPAWAEKPRASCTQFTACAAGRDDGGPPAPLMTVAADDVENLQLAIFSCWNIGVLSTRAQQVALVLRVEIDGQGRPNPRRIEMTTFSGGDDAAAAQAFAAARRAVIRGVKGCGGKQGFAFDPIKYTLPGAIEMTFDASGMRLR